MVSPVLISTESFASTFCDLLKFLHFCCMLLLGSSFHLMFPFFILLYLVCHLGEINDITYIKRTKLVPIISKDSLVRKDLTTSLNRGDKVLAVSSKVICICTVLNLYFFLSCQQLWFIIVMYSLLLKVWVTNKYSTFTFLIYNGLILGVSGCCSLSIGLRNGK